MQRHRSFEIFQFLGKRIGQSPAVHSQGVILLLKVARSDQFSVRIALHWRTPGRLQSSMENSAFVPEAPPVRRF